MFYEVIIENNLIELIDILLVESNIIRDLKSLGVCKKIDFCQKRYSDIEIVLSYYC